ncbi:MAG: MFS transporter [Actinomycetota bacterium]|nr:MFS transporter [Actinomycetota bacterium]
MGGRSDGDRSDGFGRRAMTSSREDAVAPGGAARSSAPTRTSEPIGARPRPHHRLALVVIATAQLMVMLDLTIVNIALPSMQRELHFSATNLTWVVDAYVLVFGGLLLLGGRLGDLFGRRRMFAIGIAAFAGASLAGGLATDQTWLITARAIQGIGAAIASPTALSLIVTTFEEGAPRNRAMGVYAGMSAAGGALGLLLGGVLVDVASWRWVLFVNVPIAIAVLVLTPMSLHAGRAPSRRDHRLDVPGALSISAGMALLVYGLVSAPTNGWSSARTDLAFALAALLLGVFVAVERSSREPLIPLGFLRNRNRAAGFGVMLLLGAAMLSLIFFLTQFLQDILHYSPILAGVAYLPIPFSVAGTSVAVSRLVRRYGVRRFLVVGPVLVAVGLLWVSEVNATSSYAQVFGPLVLVGLGMGLSFVPLTLNAVASVEGHQSGLASALLNTSQQVGGSLGLATLVTVAATATRDQLQHAATGLRAAGTSLSTPRLHALAAAASVHGYQMAFRWGAAGAVIAFLIAVALLRSPASGRVGPPGEPASSEEPAALHEPVALAPRA